MLGCRATKELKKAEEEGRDAELSAAEVRGKLEAEKEALVADRLAAERMAEKHQEAAKQCEVELANYKACPAPRFKQPIRQSHPVTQSYLSHGSSSRVQYV